MIDLIKKFEGCKLKAYKCPAGKWTIGYGHTLGVKQGDRITKEQAEKLLNEDVKGVIEFLNKLKLRLNPNQFEALVSFIYNIGVRNFSYSHVYELIKKDANSEKVGLEIRRWIYADGQKLRGLELRREAEKNKYYETINTDMHHT